MNLIITIKIFILFNYINSIKGCHTIRLQSELQSRVITYSEKQILTKQCFDNKICNFIDTVTKTKLITETHLRPIKRCCYRYETDENGNCMPICNNCENGYCSLPNMCVCNKGYYKSYHENKCIPTCLCLNGFCKSHDICECLKGYELSETDPFVCNPICQSNCTNGQCVGPNQCKCNSGYKYNTSSELCEPECTEICENGKCTDTNVCTCNEGFGLKLDSKNVCEPECSSGCPHGKCIEPESCLCEIGYEEKKTVLKYFNKENTLTIISTCVPVCLNGCNNGVCVSPDNCVCTFQFKLNALNECVSRCNCLRGTCVFLQNICICSTGFRHSPNNSSVCEPYCEHTCPENSFCSDPNECTCDSGFIKFNNKCENICDFTCINGKCDSKNVCNCNNDQTKIEDEKNNNETFFLETIGMKRYRCISNENDDECNNNNCTKLNDKCDSGYQFDINLNKCLPLEQGLDNLIIQKNCSDGYCDSNNTFIVSNITEKCNIENCLICFSETECLVCNQGWDTNESGICEPLCTPLCDSTAECINPNVCQCKNGYKNLTTSNQCEPICSSNCINGYCDKPNECICIEGYEVSTISKQCEPICTEKICINSSCILPNQCECHDGYQFTSFDNDTFRCELIEIEKNSNTAEKNKKGHLFVEAIGSIFFGVLATFFILYIIKKFKKNNNDIQSRANLIQNRAFENEY